MNPLEQAVAQVLGDMLTSQRLIKTGFQVVHDLRQLAASYPHISALQTIHSVLETSVLAKRVMHINKQRHARTATSSLSRMCESFLGKALQKDEQCSNWSARPLTIEQIEYAALDAAVTPIVTERLMKAVNADFFDRPQVGRWKDDRLFLNTLVSWRFLFLDSDTDANVIRKLNAKRVVGDHFVVNQRKCTMMLAMLRSFPDDSFLFVSQTGQQEMIRHVFPRSHLTWKAISRTRTEKA